MNGDSNSRSYTGITSDVEARLRAHNAGQNQSTVRYRPWQVVAAVQLDNEDAAVRFERYLKTGSGRVFVKRHSLQNQVEACRKTALTILES